MTPGELEESQGLSPEALPAQVAHPGKAVASGGSTGFPKVIVDPNPWGWSPDSLAIIGSSVGFRSGQTQLVAGALYHNSPFCWVHWGLMEDHQIILMERFDAARALELIEGCSVNYAFMVPTMMSRILQVPGVHDRDLSCLEGIFHNRSTLSGVAQACLDRSDRAQPRLRSLRLCRNGRLHHHSGGRMARASRQCGKAGSV